MNIQETLIEEKKVREDGQNKLIQMVRELDERLTQDLNVFLSNSARKEGKSAERRHFV